MEKKDILPPIEKFAGIIQNFKYFIKKL